MRESIALCVLICLLGFSLKAMNPPPAKRLKLSNAIYLHDIILSFKNRSDASNTIDKLYILYTKNNFDFSICYKIPTVISPDDFKALSNTLTEMVQKKFLIKTNNSCEEYLIKDSNRGETIKTYITQRFERE